MRDLERWKDKVELSLDGRQIFFLFFGSAVAACLIFVLGVLIGKRLEARALALTPPPVEDPLVALDQVGEADEVDEGLTFHKALTPSSQRKVEAHEKAESAKPFVAKADPPKPLVAEKPTPDEEEETPVAVSPKPALPAPKAQTAVLTPKPQAPVLAGRPQVVAKKPEAPKKEATGHFTLQLASFPERADADEFVHKIQAAGYRPFVVASDIPGKGLFYRVRVGDYTSRQSAVDAKTEFERKQRIIAYVAKL